jgi:hypothetical protein
VVKVSFVSVFYLNSNTFVQSLSCVSLVSLGASSIMIDCISMLDCEISFEGYGFVYTFCCLTEEVLRCDFPGTNIAKLSSS